MAKFGYVCRCGWRLERGSAKKQLTRVEYSLAKQNHALGIDPGADVMHQPKSCKFLARELSVTQRDMDLKRQLLDVVRGLQ